MIIFAIDLLLSMRTGYYENGIVTLNGKKIFYNWVKNYLG